MHIRKFEANSLDEAFKEIKRELGPDAIILKTVTNKGVKGVFKKSKIEITAAISEKNYVKKAKVDAVLDGEEKEKFYSSSANMISNMIDTHDDHSGESGTHVVKEAGYGTLGINRPVKTVKDIGKKIKSGLDEFLNDNSNEEGKVQGDDTLGPPPSTLQDKKIVVRDEGFKELYDLQRLKIEELEKRLYQLKKEFMERDRKGPLGVYQLRTTLKSFDISEKYIADISKKALFELSGPELEDADTVFEFSLKEMLKVVKVDQPLFSSEKASQRPVVTIFVGGNSSGQTSMIYKISTLRPDSTIIKCRKDSSGFIENIFGLNIINVSSMAEATSEARKSVTLGKCVFIDYQNLSTEIDETKKFIDGLRRSFEMVEVLISLSAIHSEIYNRSKIKGYRSSADGIVVSGLDVCLNFGSLFNIAEDAFDLPFKFFGTGEVIPDDIEAATPERILAGIFQLAG